MYENILVPTDGSKAAEEAAANAIRMAGVHDSTVHVLYAMDMGEAGFVAVPDDIKETRQRLEMKGLEFTREIEEMAQEAGVECVTAVKSGTAAETIVEYAEENDVDLIIMGKRGRSDPDKPAFGSTANRVIGSTETLVLTT